ncbi:phosphopantetheinyl transferase related enzyme [Idiomarina abyssalis]|uniref:Phosphopantetheinyl transferase related enzyme n=1 Tax=Idiomarina abyssalis TaxID=86102 RepID=A0A8I1G8S3_9GAMM|nr:phosphopantetheinyl transferase related enzyme [Idiomarina abyssalis]MBJ7266202.1 phosphopantetheinyl transferase related enzyme [Idiomarina abyssalis]MBJ7272741.1 phosphopantetheinyl transferase related enzyme [Idiomarina abyssalis]MBJ7316341.1 phosphopantetheinyl transferase related enzyme [Idiomarina abyssalis]
MVIGYRLYNDTAPPRQVSEATRDLLIQLVRKYWPVSGPVHVTIDKTPSGAPLLSVNDQPVYCSLSHKSGFIAAAYSTTCSIGIDVENLRTSKNYQRIRDYYKDGFLAGSSLTKQAFFRQWTLAEAVAKASGDPLLKVLEQPLEKQQHAAKYFRLNSFLLCGYQAVTADKVSDISLYQLDSDNQWQ